MNIKDFYKLCVITMALTSFLMAGMWIAWCIWKWVASLSGKREELPERAKSHARDAWLIFGIAAIPQVMVGLIPFFYQPAEVPVVFAEGCLMCWVTVLVLWFWGFAKLFKACSEAHTWVFAPVCIPVLASIHLLIGFCS